MNLRGKAETVVGDAIVSGTKEAIRKEILENWQSYLKIGLCAISGIAGVKLLFNIIDRPRPGRMDVHFYVHIN